MNPEIITSAEITTSAKASLASEQALVDSNRHHRGYYVGNPEVDAAIERYDHIRDDEIALEGRLHASNNLNGQGYNRGTNNFAFNVAQRMSQAFSRLDRRLVQEEIAAQDNFPPQVEQFFYSKNREARVLGGLGVASLIAAGAVSDTYAYQWYLQAATAVSAAIGFEAAFHGFQRMWDITYGHRRNLTQGEINQLNIHQTDRMVAEHTEYSIRESTHQRIRGESQLESNLRTRQEFLLTYRFQDFLQGFREGVSWLSPADAIRESIQYASRISSSINHTRRQVQHRENGIMSLRWIMGIGTALAMVAVVNGEVMPNAPTMFEGEDPYQGDVSSHYGNLQAIVARRLVEDHLIDINYLGFRECEVEETPPDCFGQFNPDNPVHTKVVFDDYHTREPLDAGYQLVALDRKLRVHGGDDIRARDSQGRLTDHVNHDQTYYLPNQRRGFLSRVGQGIQNFVPGLDDLRHWFYR